MPLRGVRGATSVPKNDEQSVLEHTRLMIADAVKANAIRPEDMAAIMFATTPDLDAAFPARAARELGLVAVPLLDFISPDVKGSMPRVVRMLLLWNTDVDQSQVVHIYLGDARKLRPDLVASKDGVAAKEAPVP